MSVLGKFLLILASLSSWKYADAEKPTTFSSIPIYILSIFVLARFPKFNCRKNIDEIKVWNWKWHLFHLKMTKKLHGFRAFFLMFFVLLQLFPIDFDDLPSNICDNVNNDPLLLSCLSNSTRQECPNFCLTKKSETDT